MLINLDLAKFSISDINNFFLLSIFLYIKIMLIFFNCNPAEPYIQSILFLV